MSKNEACFLYILDQHGNDLSTKQILDFAKLYPDLCYGCTSGSEVIMAGMSLMKKQQVERNIAKGGFRWSLMT